MIVLDCNAAVGMAMGTPDGKALRTLALEGELVIAPSLFYAELANVLGKYVRGGYFGRDLAQKYAQSALALVSHFEDVKSLWGEAMVESARLNHNAQDLFYFILARRTGSTLFTLDKKLQSLCLENGVNCVYLDNEF